MSNSSDPQKPAAPFDHVPGAVPADEANASRRKSERVGVNHEFQSIDEFITEYVSDISRNGIFIRSDDPLPKGTRVDLRFTVIDEDFETIEGTGEVTRVVPPGGKEPPGMGVVFVELTKSSETLVERLLLKRPLK